MKMKLTPTQGASTRRLPSRWRTKAQSASRLTCSLSHKERSSESLKVWQTRITTAKSLQESDSTWNRVSNTCTVYRPQGGKAKCQYCILTIPFDGIRKRIWKNLIWAHFFKFWDKTIKVVSRFSRWFRAPVTQKRRDSLCSSQSTRVNKTLWHTRVESISFVLDWICREGMVI